MTYDEAMERFGHDAPDLRFGLELVDCSDLAPQSEFGVFKSVVAEGGQVRAINAKGGGEHYSRRGIDELTEFVKRRRRQGAGVVQVRGRRQAGLARSPSSSTRRCSRSSPSGCRPSRATSFCSPPTRGR